jgi:hypothetical protein
MMRPPGNPSLPPHQRTSLEWMTIGTSFASSGLTLMGPTKFFLKLSQSAVFAHCTVSHCIAKNVRVPFLVWRPTIKQTSQRTHEEFLSPMDDPSPARGLFSSTFIHFTSLRGFRSIPVVVIFAHHSSPCNDGLHLMCSSAFYGNLSSAAPFYPSPTY